MHVCMTAIRRKFYAAHDKPDGKESAESATKGISSMEESGLSAPLLLRGDTAFILPADVNVPPSEIRCSRSSLSLLGGLS